jgi:pimeloyl-ACP methyl ester carboxylesterase
VRFNLSGAGMRPGDELVTDPAAFRDNTYSREVEDLLAVLAAVGTTIAPGRVDLGRLGLVGHSRGGGNAVLAAAYPDWRDRIGALVTWAAIAQVDRFTPEQKEEWRRMGEAPVVNSRTGQQLAMGLSMLADVEDHRDALDIEAAAAVRTAPWLIIHGDKDESVPAAEGRILAQVGKGETELLMIPETDHTFGSRHPFAGSTPALIEAMSATRLWLHRHLVAGER